MKGTISTYLPEKKYGFIKGDDGKDYYFHEDAFKSESERAKLSEEAFVDFDQRATPRGYKARNCRLLDTADVLTYVVPDAFLTSRSRGIKGWEVIERGNWIVHGSSEDSPDAARRYVIDRAVLLGANALLNLEYYKTTGSEPGTGRGTHHFTIHNFHGRIATIAKRNAKGPYKSGDLSGLNRKAALLKKELAAKSGRSKRKRNLIWVTIIGLSAFLAVIIQDVSVSMIVILLVFGFVFGRSTDYDWWLHEA